jgi:tetraacyldisaccharide 4'-kinase
MMRALLEAGARVYGAAWEARRLAYARGLWTSRAVDARVVSIGNVTVGGTGKTTLALHLARQARQAGADVAVVCRRYHPGPGGHGDEELLYAAALGADRVYAGARKLDEAARAAAAGRALVIVDDGFSHWPLARDLDVVLLDAGDPWGGGRLLPAGRLREPRRSLQRADVLVLTRVEPGEDLARRREEAIRYAPAARFAAGRHRVAGVRGLDGAEVRPSGPAHVVTATGNPRAVERSAREAGFEPTTLSAYRDHHWFTAVEARGERERARARRATLVISAKDAVRWPREAGDGGVAVLEVAWEWIEGGDEVERMVWSGGSRA